MVFFCSSGAACIFQSSIFKLCQKRGRVLRFITGSKHQEIVESTGPYRYSLKASEELLLLDFKRDDSFCMVCLLIILSEPLGLLSLENCFLHQWKMWRKRDQKGSDWTRGQHVRMENYEVSPLCRTSSTMPDAGKSKLILVCFESHKTVITRGTKELKTVWKNPSK